MGLVMACSPSEKILLAGSLPRNVHWSNVVELICSHITSGNADGIARNCGICVCPQGGTRPLFGGMPGPQDPWELRVVHKRRTVHEYPDPQSSYPFGKPRRKSGQDQR